MINDLDEINRVLLVFDQHKTTSFEKNDLIKRLRKSPMISQAMMDHDATLEFCNDSKILKEKNGIISLDKRGLTMLQLLKKNNSDNLFDINEEQCDLLNAEVFLRPISYIVNIIKEYFLPDDTRETWSYDYYENPPLPDAFMEYFNILKQSKLIIEYPGVFEINKKYAKQVSLLFSRGRLLSEETLMQILADHKKVGNLAEEKVLEYEKNELIKASYLEEAELVKRVSKWDVAAGYDIKSFNGHSANKRHDKFIEVKGSKINDFRFYWSENERKKAEELRDRYWIYFVPNVYASGSINPIKIQDPIQKIFRSPRYRKSCIGYEISIQ